MGKSSLMFTISNYYYDELLPRGYTPIHATGNVRLTPSLTWVSSLNSQNAVEKEPVVPHARLSRCQRS